MTNQTSNNSDNSIINSIKRLERAGDERSKATRKLCDAAFELCDYLLKTLPSNFSVLEADWREKDDPSYVLRIKGDSDLTIEHMGTYCNYGEWHNITRGMAQGLAQAVAEGLLDKVAAELERQKKGAEQATETTKSATFAFRENI